MADTFQFRAALHGFNRRDVVEYIEVISREHAKAIRELEQKTGTLSSRVEQLEAENETLAEEAAALRAQLDDTCAELETARAASEATEADIVSDLTTEEVPAAPSPDEMELAAYRRAEAVERNAARRAGVLYQQMSAVCLDLTQRLRGSDEEIALLYTDLTTSLDRLRETLADVKLILDSAPEQIQALDRSDSDEEAAC